MRQPTSIGISICGKLSYQICRSTIEKYCVWIIILQVQQGNKTKLGETRSVINFKFPCKRARNDILFLHMYVQVESNTLKFLGLYVIMFYCKSRLCMLLKIQYWNSIRMMKTNIYAYVINLHNMRCNNLLWKVIIKWQFLFIFHAH